MTRLLESLPDGAFERGFPDSGLELSPDRAPDAEVGLLCAQHQKVFARLVLDEHEDGEPVGERNRGLGSCHNRQVPKNAHNDGGLQSQIGKAPPTQADGCGSPDPPIQGTEAPADRGSRGEALAARFLRCERGFRILAQNWHNPYDKREEIDLIAQKDGATVFVEVKTRTAGALVPGYFAVDRRKKRALRGAIRAYLGMHLPRPRSYRLDVVEVEIGDGPPGIRHFENVGLFGGFDP